MIEELNIKQLLDDTNNRINNNDAQMLLAACRETNAKICVEIGCFDGGSTLILGNYLKNVEGGKLFSIDPSTTELYKNNLIKYRLKPVVQVIPKRSPWVTQSATMKQGIDVLFIDGDHRLLAVIADFYYWFPIVSKGGIILFHDWQGRISGDGIDVGQEVRQAVRIIEERYKDKLVLFSKDHTPGKGMIAYKKV